MKELQDIVFTNFNNRGDIGCVECDIGIVNECFKLFVRQIINKEAHDFQGKLRITHTFPYIKSGGIYRWEGIR
ncbi:hypothetical protein ES703_123739 [subsurface metagenome]